jgi:2-methylcitrate dehydratase PrpD
VLGKAGLEQFTDACVNDPKVSAMRRRISVTSDPTISTIAVDMEFTTADGKVQKMSTRAAKGSAANPLKDAEIEQKLRDEAKSWNARHDIQPLIDAVWSLDRSADVSGLAGLATPR